MMFTSSLAFIHRPKGREAYYGAFRHERGRSSGKRGVQTCRLTPAFQSAVQGLVQRNPAIAHPLVIKSPY